VKPPGGGIGSDFYIASYLRPPGLVVVPAVMELLGDVLSGLSALSFSSASALYRSAMRGLRVNPFVASGLRAAPVLAFMLAIYPFLGTGLAKPPAFYLYVLASTLLAFFAGDAAFLEGLSRAPLSVVYPAAYTFSLFATLFAWAFLGEEASPNVVAAALVVVAGVYLTYRGGGGGGDAYRGIAYGLAASVSWAGSILFAAAALRMGNSVDVNTLRVAYLLLLSLPLVALEWRRGRLGGYRVGRLAAGGLLGIGVGPVLFFAGISLAGVARSSVIVSSTPVLTVLLARLALGEEVGGSVAAGAAAVALGTALLYI